MTRLHFDARDLFRAARLGWSLKRMWIAFCGILVHYLIYAGFAYAGLVLAEGSGFGDLWSRYGFFPVPSPTIPYGIGAILASLVLLVTAGAVCKVTYQSLRGDAFYSSGEAWKFLRKAWTSVICGPLAVLILFVFFLFCGWFIGLLGRYLPWLGEFGVAAAFFPVFFASLLAVFIAFALVVSVLFSPAIVGTTREDALEVVIQSFSLLWSQPWRLPLYLAGLLVTVGIGTSVLGCLTFYAIYLINAVCGLAMGQKLSAMMFVALNYVPQELLSFFFTWGWLSAPDLLARLPETGGWPTGSLLWAGRLLAVSLLLVAGFVLSYAFSAWCAGTTLIYVILKKRKDDENLLEREEEESSGDKEPSAGEGARPTDADPGPATPAAAEKGPEDAQKETGPGSPGT